MTGPADRGPRKLRLFFALWPVDGLRERLATSARAIVPRVDGQPVPPGNLHVTLAFLGMVAGARLAELFPIGGEDHRPAVELRFERVEYWAKPKVLVVMPSAIPDNGRRIVDRLWDRLETLGFTRETRPWQPHLTLVRRIRRPPDRELSFAPAVTAGVGDWRLALVESTTHPEGPRYKPLAQWELGGDSPL